MKTIVVSADLSDLSRNAIHYAAQLAVINRQTDLIIYHHYSTEWDRDLAKDEFAIIKEQLLRDYAIVAQTVLHFGEDFIGDLENLLESKAADLLVMGITGKGKMAQAIIGSNTQRMVESKICPVMIIPEGAEYRLIKHVMLASDFRDTNTTTPIGPITKLLDHCKAQLHIVNVDPSHYIALTAEYQHEMDNLQQVFEKFNPDFHFMRLHDVDEAIRLLAEDKDIDLIITIRKNRSFMEKLLTGSRTRSLSYKTNIPMIVVHE